jgi:three-Cys-motif partner protein
MGRATFHQAADGFPARDAASWTEEKLMILTAYLERFATATKKAGGWYGLDLFAGTGLNWSTTRDETIDGSALVALRSKPQAMKLIAAEKHPSAFEALAARTEPYGKRAALFNEDANRIVEKMLAPIPRRAPAFAFLDPEGSELEWPTVEAIAAHKAGYSPNKIEQLILFPTDMGFVRLAPDHPELVSRIYGHDRWRQIFERRATGDITAEQARSEYVRLYGEGLTGLGYRVVLDRQIRKSNGSPMYFLIFATDNEAGERIMDHVFDQVHLRVNEELGQTTLFKIENSPRERRLSDG